MHKKVIRVNKNILQWILFIAAVFLFVIEFERGIISGITLAVALLWGVSILSCLLNFTDKMFCFWLEVTIGVFLIARPLIMTLEGEKWWNVGWLTQEDIIQALLIIALSLIAIFVGMNIAFSWKTKIVLVSCKCDESGEKFQKNLQAVSLAAFYFTAFFSIIVGIEKVLFCQSHSYLEYYTSFKSQLPWFIGTISSLMKYCLCIFLATWPRKRRTFFALALFELTALFDLYVGIRGTIVLHSIFIVVYYLLRDIKKDKEKWFGKLEKYLVAIGTPVMMVFMVAYSSIRSGLRVMDFHFFESIRDFFVSQGVTFEVVARGISVADRLPQRAGRNYTFGTMIDYVIHGRVGQLLFGTEALPEGNNIINGTESNSLAHNLSYLTRGDEYLQGKGWGSSYVLENYIDFNYVGVIIFSLVLGLFLVKALQCTGQKILWNIIVLVSLLNIFYIPRAESTGWLAFIITFQFWFCVGCCFAGAFLAYKVKPMGNLLLALKLYPSDVEYVKNKKSLSYWNARRVKVGLVVLICSLLFLMIFAINYQSKHSLKGSIECNFSGGAAYEGQLLRIYARVEGQGKDYQYQFTEVYNGKQEIVQRYSEKNGYAFESTDPGVHIFYIDVKNNKGERGTLTVQIDIKER